MKTNTKNRLTASLMTLIFLFLLPSLAFSANFAGKWKVNAAGHKMTVLIDQNGSATSGLINGGSGINDRILRGHVSGNKIVFVRTNDILTRKGGGGQQVYTGYMSMKGPRIIAGTWTYKGKTHGWFATL